MLDAHLLIPDLRTRFQGSFFKYNPNFNSEIAKSFNQSRKKRKNKRVFSLPKLDFSHPKLVFFTPETLFFSSGERVKNRKTY